MLVAKQGFQGFQTPMDAESVYWVDEHEQSTIVRMRKSDGTLERIPSGPNRYVQALAVDACNVYWAVANPAAIYARSK